MNNRQTPTAPLEQAFIDTGNLVGTTLGRPKEQKAEATVATVPTSRIQSLTQLHLPDRIAQILEIPLERLKLKLERNQAMHSLLNKMIDYHEIQTAKGKIVLTYFGKELVDKEVVEDVWTFKTFSPLGFIFNKKYTALFVLSDAAQVRNDYQEMIAVWRENLSYEEVELLLNDKISLLEESDPDVRFFRIQEMFGLSEEGSSEDDVAEELSFDREKFRILLNDLFKLDDIRKLCFDLEVDYENLDGESKESKVIALIEHFENRLALLALLEQCQKIRPQAPWQEVLDKPG